MIVADTEFTGLNPGKCGLWQIGALELENPGNAFLEESRIDDDDEVEPAALKVVEKTEAEIRDNSKQSQKQMLKNFFDWSSKIKVKNLICHGPWDFAFLLIKAKKYNLDFPFPHRMFDTHSIAQIKYFENYKKFLIEEDKSAMNLASVLNFCGIPDNRRIVEIGGKTSKQGEPHNALEDTKLTAEAFSRLAYGKNLLQDYAQFKIPGYLK